MPIPEVTESSSDKRPPPSSSTSDSLRQLLQDGPFGTFLQVQVRPTGRPLPGASRVSERVIGVTEDESDSLSSEPQIRHVSQVYADQASPLIAQRSTV